MQTSTARGIPTNGTSASAARNNTPGWGRWSTIARKPSRSPGADMIGKLIELCARHRGLVILFYVLLAVGAVKAVRAIKLDAIPDLSDPQVIVFTEWKGRSPTVIEDQITYPIASRLLAAP